jgi:thiamine-phosphate diphosphorylase
MIAGSPVLCAVTDRRRLGAGEGVASLDALIAQITEAAEADFDLVQIREPDLPAAVLLNLVTRAIDAVRDVPGTRTQILINDRLDVALAAGADGVHLRGESVEAPRVRACLRQRGDRGEFVIGRAVHSADEANAVAAAGGVDYLVLGTMYPTVSKPVDHIVAGPETLHRAVLRCRVPILGIGGITLDTARAIAETGAAGIAAIGLFLGRCAGEYDLDYVARVIRQIFADVRESSSIRPPIP